MHLVTPNLYFLPKPKHQKSTQSLNLSKLKKKNHEEKTSKRESKINNFPACQSRHSKCLIFEYSVQSGMRSGVMWPIIGMEGGHVICDYVLSRDLKVITVQVH